jgi:hypothetical protein
MIFVRIRYKLVDVSTQPLDLSRFDHIEVEVPFLDEQEDAADLLAFDHFKKGFWVKKEKTPQIAGETK